MSASIAPAITPYWHRMPSFFAWPLRRPALDLLLITVALGVVPALTGSGLIAFGCALAMLFLLCKYGYESLQTTAAGDDEPPALSDALSGEGYVLPLKQFGVLIALMFMVIVAWQLGGAWLGVPAIFAITLLFPATVILLAMERSFLTAVNPMRLMALATAIGWPYLGLFGLLLCIQIATGTSLALVETLMPGESGLAVNIATGTFLGNYFWLMAFHMMGYVVYQYHDRLGYSAIDPQEEGFESELGLFHELMEQQNHAAALAELRRVIDLYPDEPSLRRRLLQLARLSGDSATLIREGKPAIGASIRAGRLGEAAEIYLDCIAAKADFQPADVDQHEPLARELRSRGLTRDAMALLNGLHQRYPDSPHIPRAYLLAARIFLDDLGKPDQAGKILHFIGKRFPDNDYQPEIESLLRSVARAKNQG